MKASLRLHDPWPLRPIFLTLLPLYITIITRVSKISPLPEFDSIFLESIAMATVLVNAWEMHGNAIKKQVRRIRNSQIPGKNLSDVHNEV